MVGGGCPGGVPKVWFGAWHLDSPGKSGGFLIALRCPFLLKPSTVVSVVRNQEQWLIWHLYLILKITYLLRYNLYTIQLTYLKCIIQWFLVYSLALLPKRKQISTLYNLQYSNSKAGMEGGELLITAKSKSGNWTDRLLRCWRGNICTGLHGFQDPLLI